jgi:hypothetical protein
MEIPKVPIYKYKYTAYPTHIIRLYDYIEPIEPGSIQFAYYTVCCTLGRKRDFYKKVMVARFSTPVVDDSECVGYLSTFTVAKLLMSIDSPNTEGYYHNHINFTRVKGMADAYDQDFKRFIKEKAARFIQNKYLDFYYNPARPFCIRRLLRDFEELQKETIALQS